ncbi:MAG: hypothetical protein V7K15_11515 [Nostoc sp.]
MKYSILQRGGDLRFSARRYANAAALLLRQTLLCERLRQRERYRKYHWILGRRPGLSNLNP